MYQQNMLVDRNGRIFHIERDLCVHLSNQTRRNFLVFLGQRKSEAEIPTTPRVALKLPNYENSSEEDRIRATFKREADLLSQLEPHENIVTYIEHGMGTFRSVEHSDYLALKYVDGDTLREILRDRPLTIYETLEIVRQIAAALDHLHDRGIFHCDIKPSNIMIDYSEKKVVLIDFGSAWTQRRRPSATAMISKEYMAPEQIETWAKCDETTDLYALSLVIYEMLAGQQLWEGRQTMDISHGRKITPSVDIIMEGLSHLDAKVINIEKLAHMIKNCQEAEQKRRDYRRAGALYQALRELVA